MQAAAAVCSRLAPGQHRSQTLNPATCSPMRGLQFKRSNKKSIKYEQTRNTLNRSGQIQQTIFEKYCRKSWRWAPLHPDPGCTNLRSIIFSAVFFGSMMFLRGSLLPQGVTSSSQAWSPWGSSKTQMILNLRGSAIFAFCCKLQLDQSRHQYYWLCIISNWRIKWKWILKIHLILISWLKISKKDGWLPLQRVWKMFWRGNQPLV